MQPCQFFHFSYSGAPSLDIGHLGIKSCLYAREEITTPRCLQGKIAKTMHPILMAQCSRMGLHCHRMQWCRLSISSWCGHCISTWCWAAFLHGAGLQFLHGAGLHFCMAPPWHFCTELPQHFYAALPLYYLHSTATATCLHSTILVNCHMVPPLHEHEVPTFKIAAQQFSLTHTHQPPCLSP